MGLDFIKYREIGCYEHDCFCGILPKLYELRHEFSIGSGSNDKKYKNKNIEDKVREQGEGTVRVPHKFL